jgi:phospholipid/cholesterol/gamma-HCH transport system substrate-binding protein
MAQRKQISWSELRVGVFVLAGLIVLAVVILYVTRPGILGAKYRVRTYLPEVELLKVGAPVRLSGVEVGNVEAIRMNPKPADRLHNIEIIMRIDKRYQGEIRRDSKARLITEGLLGNRFVSIDRGFEGDPIPNDGEVTGLEEVAIKNIVERGAELVQNLDEVSKVVRKMVTTVQQGEGTLGKLLTDEEAWDRLNAVFADLQAITADTRAGRNSLGKLVASDELYNRVNSAAGRLDTVVADVQTQKGSLGKFIYDPALYERAREFVNKGNAALDNVQSGKGTLGKLYVDESLYEKWRSAGENVSQAAARLNSTQGTAGRFFSDPQLYDNLTGLTGDLRLLVGDFRQNPKKYLRVKFSVF